MDNRMDTTANPLPTPKWELWTPDHAREALNRMAEYGPNANRSLRAGHVKQLIDDMVSGKWVPNGATIQFSGDRLIDGQHRLEAIARCGRTVPLLTVRGVPDYAIQTVDTGLLRSAGDTTRIHRPNLQYHNTLAGMARMVYLYDTYRNVAPFYDRIPSRQQILATVDKFADPMLMSARWLAGPAATVLGRPNWAATWHYMFGRKFPVERDAFFADLVSGVGLKEGQPVHTLRQKLIQRRSMRATLRSDIWSAMVIKSWNAEMSGRELRSLRYNETEQFPVMFGDDGP